MFFKEKDMILGDKEIILTVKNLIYVCELFKYKSGRNEIKEELDLIYDDLEKDNLILKANALYMALENPLSENRSVFFLLKDFIILFISRYTTIYELSSREDTVKSLKNLELKIKNSFFSEK